ncbi:MAG: hypothetical protein IT376_22750 [Polyangiaceae bacterium]|nr:hypothetical protein [Polyangiaceae bacterium]
MATKTGSRRGKTRRRAARAPAQDDAGGRARALWWLVAPVAALVAFHGLRHAELVADARFLIVENAYLRDPSRWWEHATSDYFWSSSGNIIPYWRPLTKLSWLLEYQLFAARPLGYHLVQLGWHALGIAGAQLLARQLGASRAAAMVVGLVVALHPVAVEPVCLVMARSDVVAATASAWAVLGWLAWRARAEARGWLAVHVAATLAALASKEASVALAPALVAWALLRGDWRRGERRRLWTLAPVLGLTALYLPLRRHLLERVATGLAEGGATLDPLRLYAGLGIYARNVWPLSLESTVRDVSIAEAMSAGFALLTVPSLAALAGLVVLAARRREQELLALLAWALLALAPVLVAERIWVPAVEGKLPFADRWLFHALTPSTLACWFAWERWASRPVTEWLGARHARAALALCAAGWAGVVTWRTLPARAELANERAMLDNEDRLYYFAVPAEYRTREDQCRFYQRRVVRARAAGRDAEVVDAAREVERHCSDAPDVQIDVLATLLRQQRREEAVALARKLLARPPADRRGHAQLAELAGSALLAGGYPGEAEPLFVQALRLGGGSCRSWIAAGEAARASGQSSRAADHLERAWECGKKADPSLLLAAATWLVEAHGDAARIGGLLDRAASSRLEPDQAAQLATLRAALRGAASAGSPRLAPPRLAPPASAR